MKDAFGEGKEESEITGDTVRDLAGIPKTSHINKIIKNIVEEDLESLLISIKEVIDDGKDLDNFLWEIIKYVKDMLIYKSTSEIALYSDDEKAAMKAIVDLTSKERLFSLIYSLSELAANIKWSTQKTIMMQVGLMKCAQVSVVTNQVNPEEQGLPRTPTPTKNVLPKQVNRYVGDDVPSTETVPQKKTPSSPGEFAGYWPKVLDNLRTSGKIMLYTNLLGTKAKKTNDLCVEIQFANQISAFAKTVLDQHENKEEIVKLISMEEGQKMEVKYTEGESATGANVRKWDAIVWRRPRN